MLSFQKGHSSSLCFTVFNILFQILQYNDKAQVSDENTHIFQVDKQSLFKANIILCSTNSSKAKEKSMHLHDFAFLSVKFRDSKGKAFCRC